jgi:gas vesicle protein
LEIHTKKEREGVKGKMSKDSGFGLGSIFAAFLAGGILGAGAAFLLTPKTGKETREAVKQKAQELEEKTKELREEIGKKTEELIDQGKETLREMKEKLDEAVVSIKETIAGKAKEEEKKGEEEKTEAA